MKKVLILLLFPLLYSNMGFAESYYFKKCKLTEVIYGNYLIDFNKSTVDVILKIIDGPPEKRIHEIKSITKDQIVTKKNQIIGYKDLYIQYYLDAVSNSITTHRYKNKNGDFKLEGRNISFCSNVKKNWDMPSNTKTEKSGTKKENLMIESSLPTCKGNDYKKWTNCQNLITAFEYKYYGEWKDGKVHGKGHEEWQDGRKYIGEFKKDKREGQGTATYPDGSIYIGEWKNGEQDGQGTYTFASGKIYSGQFKNGSIIKGTAKYTDGTKYEGEFEFGKPKKKKEETKIENKHRILISGSKVTRTGWVKEKSRLDVEEKLKKYFNKQAAKICSLTENFKIIQQTIKVLELKEMSKLLSNEKVNVYRLEIDGVVICN